MHALSMLEQSAPSGTVQSPHLRASAVCSTQYQVLEGQRKASLAPRWHCVLWYHDRGSVQSRDGLHPSWCLISPDEGLVGRQLVTVEDHPVASHQLYPVYNVSQYGQHCAWSSPPLLSFRGTLPSSFWEGIPTLGPQGQSPFRCSGSPKPAFGGLQRR